VAYERRCGGGGAMRLRVCGAEGAVAQRALVRWRAGGGRRRRGSSAGGARARRGARSDARRRRRGCVRAADGGGAVAVQTPRAADGDGQPKVNGRHNAGERASGRVVVGEIYDRWTPQFFLSPVEPTLRY
jgi:hypothetical protein